MKTIKIFFVYLIIILIAELSIKNFFPEYKSLNHGIGITGGVPFKLNSYGLRDVEFDFDKKDKYRILCLGDSITFGTQNRLDDIYPNVLERLLNADGRNKYQVINAGGVGKNPYSEYCYLEEKGILFNLDYVILGLCLNDVGNCYTEKKKKGNLIENVNQNNLKSQLNHLRWYLRKSCLFSCLDANLTRFMYRIGIKKYSFNLYKEKEELLCFGIDITSEEGWELLFDSLINIKNFLVKKNIGFIIVVFPYEFQLSNDIKDNFFNIDKTKFTINPQQKLINFGKDNRIVILDLLPYFKNFEKKLYFPFDYCHPNIYGHKIAAEKIYNILLQLW